MIIALIAKLIVKHIPSLKDEIAHSIPHRMQEARTIENRVTAPCSNCSIKEKDCWDKFILNRKFCCDKCKHGNMERK